MRLSYYSGLNRQVFSAPAPLRRARRTARLRDRAKFSSDSITLQFIIAFSLISVLSTFLRAVVGFILKITDIFFTFQNYSLDIPIVILSQLQVLATDLRAFIVTKIRYLFIQLRK